MITALSFLNEVADRVGYPQITTLEVPVNNLLDEHRKLLRLLNRTLQSIGGYNDWPFLREEAQIVLLAAEVGDADTSEFVTATLDSTTVTIDNATLDETYIGRAFQVSGDEYVYRIASVTSPTQFELTRAWVNASITAATELTYCIAMDRYALPTDFSRPVDDWLNFFHPHKVRPVDALLFRQRRRENPSILAADPEVYTLSGLINGAQVVHFDPFPENKRMLSYEYMRNHPIINSDQDMILFPSTYIGALVDAMIEIIDRDYESNAKMDKVLQDSLRRHNLQQSNPGATESFPVIQPANMVRRQLRGAYGFPSSQIDWGDAFDTGEIYGL